MGSLTNEQLDFYNKNGYIILDLLDKEEIKKFSNDYNEVFDSKIGLYDLDATWQGNWRTDKEEERVRRSNLIAINLIVYYLFVLICIKIGGAFIDKKYICLKVL